MVIIAALQGVFALVLAATGVALLVGGIRLMMLGGSAYYLIAGLSITTGAVLLWRKKLSGVYLYAATLLATVIWAVWEVGFDAWALLPRVGLLGAFGAWLLLPIARRGLAPLSLDVPLVRSLREVSAPLLVIAGVAFSALAGWALHSVGPAPQLDPILQAGMQLPRDAAVVRKTAPAAATEWRHYGSDAGGSHFSPAGQITKANVGKLQIAWMYRAGPGPSGYGTLEVTPLKVGKALYLCTGYNDVIALDADSGREIWRYQARVNAAGVAAFTCRGVGYYRIPGATGVCAERVYTNTVDARLIALDARDGRPCSDFGTQGAVSLLVGMGEVVPGNYYVTSAPTVVRGKIVLGGYVADGQYWGEPSGVIRAFDAITGRLAWAFDVGRPDRAGEPPRGSSIRARLPMPGRR